MASTTNSLSPSLNGLPRQTIDDSPRTRLLSRSTVSEKDLLKTIIPLLHFVIKDFFVRVREHYFELAENSKYIEQQSEYLGLIEKLSSGNTDFDSILSEAIMRQRPSHRGVEKVEPTKISELSLTEENVLECDIAVAKIRRDLSAKSLLSLQGALKNYEQVLGVTVEDEDCFPYSPGCLLDAMAEVFQRLSIAHEQKPKLIRVFESVLAGHAETFYSKLNGLLADQNDKKPILEGQSDNRIHAVENNQSNQNNEPELSLIPIDDEIKAESSSEDLDARDNEPLRHAVRDDLILDYVWSEQVEEKNFVEQEGGEDFSALLTFFYELMHQEAFAIDRPLNATKLLDLCKEKGSLWVDNPKLESTILDVTSTFKSLVELPFFSANLKQSLWSLQLPALIYSLQEKCLCRDLSMMSDLIDAIAELAIGWPEANFAPGLSANEAPVNHKPNQVNWTDSDPLTLISPVLKALLQSNQAMADACRLAAEALEAAWFPVKSRQTLLSQRLLAKEEGQYRFNSAMQKADLVYFDIRGDSFCLKVADVSEAQKESPVPKGAVPHQGTRGQRALFLDRAATQGVPVEVTGQ